MIVMHSFLNIKHSMNDHIDEDEWILVTTGRTNTIPGSIHEVELDLARICPIMSNKEFRALFVRLRDAAAQLILDRIEGLSRWDRNERERVATWFGRADQNVRGTLETGLPRLLTATRELKPENVIRWDEQTGINITCTVFPDDDNTDAAVCKPDSARRIITIYPHFCTLPDADLWTACKLKTIIHECTHYTDVFDSDDLMYGQGTGLQYWVRSHPEFAIRNADSLAAYVAHFDRKLW